jgi:hypothetical protein
MHELSRVFRKKKEEKVRQHYLITKSHLHTHTQTGGSTHRHVSQGKTNLDFAVLCSDQKAGHSFDVLTVGSLLFHMRLVCTDTGTLAAVDMRSRASVSCAYVLARTIAHFFSLSLLCVCVCVCVCVFALKDTKTSASARKKLAGLLTPTLSTTTSAPHTSASTRSLAESQHSPNVTEAVQSLSSPAVAQRTTAAEIPITRSRRCPQQKRKRSRVLDDDDAEEEEEDLVDMDDDEDEFIPDSDIDSEGDDLEGSCVPTCLSVVSVAGLVFLCGISISLCVLHCGVYTCVCVCVCVFVYASVYIIRFYISSV